MDDQKSIQDLLNFSIINLDKPSGPTSFSVSGHVRKILGVTKTAHFGTLDPQVSGVLPLALGRACRLNDFLMHKNKTYVGIMRLHADISKEKLESEMNNFFGKITQMPPVRSRVKRAFRDRTVFKFELIEKEDKDALFIAEVEAGTYIRTLINDLGKNIGGAHMLELRRTKAAIFSEEDKNFVNLYDLEKAVDELKEGNEEALRKILIPAEETIKKVMPTLEIEEEKVSQIYKGKPLMKLDKIDLNKIHEEVFALFCKEKFIAIMKKADQGDIIAKPLFVYN
ncbi:RNA-guided pseudouridylation complex pseudouridine synthase subunit Cbf5 [Candidatus Pacearchaeota archaeon]|nr:RNA-guided pseudouridylation complex pseudouridine synthase subunit Cbf5 [Candidatus Pacearchaeota archaeon]